MMRANKRNNGAYITFERPLEVKVMTIDGTWVGESLLVCVAEYDAQIMVTDDVAKLTEFFLLLTGFGNPVFRRCKREWIDGAMMGVSFKRTIVGMRSLQEVLREAEQEQ